MEFDSGYLNTTAGFLTDSNYGSYHSSFRTHHKSIDSGKFHFDTKPVHKYPPQKTAKIPRANLIRVEDDSFDTIDGEDLDEQVQSLGESIVPRSTMGRSVGNFDKMYLDLGQLPSKSTQSSLILRRKYNQAKDQACKKDEVIRELSHHICVEKSLKKDQKALCCKYIQSAQKQQVTEIALKEALELSNLLIDKVKSMDYVSSCVSTPRFDSSPEPSRHHKKQSYGDNSYL